MLPVLSYPIQCFSMEGCSECNWELGPPPDSIMAIPPPPMPAFLHLAPTNVTTPPCNIFCDWNTGQGVEFIELPRQGMQEIFIIYISLHFQFFMIKKFLNTFLKN